MQLPLLSVRRPWHFAFGTLLAWPGLAAAQDLTVYTYSSFISEWGPGPIAEELFEAQCDCDLEFVGVDDGVALLSRLRLEGGSSPADVVLGLDLNLVAEAIADRIVVPHGLELPPLDLPIEWTDEYFVPYDWGNFAFVYDTEALEFPPSSLRDLVENSDVEILIQDPRTSTPGLGLLLWLRQVYGEAAPGAWAQLQPRIVAVTSGWSEAYGMFLEGEAPMVLSYTTSPAYHRIAEQVDRYAAGEFSEGHYTQVEVAGISSTSDNPELAGEFLMFLLSPEFQAAIPTTNWMYPVRLPPEGLPDGFTPVPESAALLYPSETVRDNRQAWIDEWLTAMSR
ncbi:MAG: thiamine ABC transporter substrate binding subunit [Pseudomonadota bacterium]